MLLPKKALLAVLPFFLQANAQASGSGKTTRYWDCCKPSCGWTNKIALASGSNPVGSCDINDNHLTNYDAKPGCSGGSAYMCTDQQPWAVSDTLAYGFGAVSIAGGTEASWCCACYELTFTSTSIAGKKLIIQATNTGGDLASNQFDLAIPGGGLGIFNGCTAQWGTPSTGWGAQYGGVSGRSQCDALPAKLKAGCYWRYDWFENADNPSVTFKQVTCPAALTGRTGCVRAGEVPSGSLLPTYTAGASLSGIVPTYTAGDPLSGIVPTYTAGDPLSSSVQTYTAGDASNGSVPTYTAVDASKGSVPTYTAGGLLSGSIPTYTASGSSPTTTVVVNC